MAPHSSTLSWRIPGTEEPGGLPSMGLQRVGHDWSDLAAAAYITFCLSIHPCLSFVTAILMGITWYHIVVLICNFLLTSLVAQMVKCLSTMRETRVQSPGREDPLEEEKATHFSFTAWKVPWTEEPSRLQSSALQRVGHNWSNLASWKSRENQRKRQNTSKQVNYMHSILCNLL